MYYRDVPARLRVFALVAVLVLAVVASPVAVGPGAITADGTGDAIGPTTAVAAQSDNETERHRNPAEYAEDGDQEALADWFEQRLTERLRNSSIELSQGQYDLASEYVGEEFEEQFDEYADVAGDTGREETADRIEEMRETQKNLSETRQEYEETREAYEQARQAGDDQRARELARELEDLAGQIDASATALSDHYDAIEEDTGADLDDARESVASVDREVRETQGEIREAEFETTRLSIRRTDGGGPISFSNPMEATGSVETASGDPIGGETVRLAVGNQTLTVTTDASGSFSFTYRPLSLPVSAASVPVAYVPENSSVYLGSETEVEATVESVEPTIAPVTAETDAVAFGDELGVESAVTVDGTPVDDLPLLVRLGGESLGTVRTDEDGTISGSVSISATVPAGERELTLAVPFEDRALSGASVATTVTVEETPSSLSIDANRAGERLVVNGTFAAAGEGIEGQSIVIAVDGESVATTETAADGSFETTATLPESASGEVTVTASTDGAGTNLESAEASDVIVVSGGPIPGIPTWLAVALGVAVLVALAGGWWLWRRDGTVRESGLPLSMEPDAGSSTDDSPTATRSAATVLLSRAVDERRAGRPDEAIGAAYGAVRRHLGGDRTDARTHWEFYREYASANEEGHGETDDLRALTEEYERATFGPEPVAAAVAERALSRARDLCGLEGSRGDGNGSEPVGGSGTRSPGDD